MRLKGSSDQIIGNYFDLLETTISHHKLADFPCQIFNLDESGFPKPPKIVTKKGEKHPIALSSNERTNITVLACCNAGGYAIPPLVIFDRKTLNPELILGEVPGTMYGLSDSGWIDSEIFETWFTNHFLAYAPPARPLLLLMDGHSSHFSPLFVNRAAEEDIVVFCLPPHSTHKTQPLDKGVFGPLKREWREECHDYLLKNPGKVVSGYQFSYLFGRAWMKAVTPHNILKGFEVTGIYPINRYKLLPKKTPSTEHTGLFIPLLTPVRHSLVPTYDTYSDDVYLSDESESNNDLHIPVQSNPTPPVQSDSPPPSFQPHSSSVAPFTADEILLFSKRKEGYDITTDDRYNYWLSLESNAKAAVMQLFTKIIRAQSVPPSIKYPDMQPKSTARVLTSKECLAEINEKHFKKMEKQKKLEERKN